MAEPDRGKGHRERLRQRFNSGQEHLKTDGFLLELLLTYAIPKQDVRSLSDELLSRFGSLPAVLQADLDKLCEVNGVKANTATLLRLVGEIYESGSRKQPDEAMPVVAEATHTNLITNQFETPSNVDATGSAIGDSRRSISRRGTGLFARAVLKPAIEILPKLPSTSSVVEIKEFLKSNLHFSAERTRNRFSDYIVSRMFPSGSADEALLLFAKRYPNRQELRDVCFYRFCKAEPVMYTIIDELIRPAIGAGHLNRQHLKDYLADKFPSVSSTKDYAQAISEALADGGIAKVDRHKINCAYREVLMPSFAFILYSEFNEPGIYPIEDLERSVAIRAMLWNPDRILSSLYELRNLGLIAKVSEIDSVRQFTTRWNLDQLVSRLVNGAVSA
jgi:hypothetical protein